MHLTDDQLDRLLRQEMQIREATSAHAHLAACTQCTQRQQEMEEEDRQIIDALAMLDRATPSLDVATVIRRAGSRATNRWRLAAAAAVLVFASGALAMPGSPLRAWLQRSILKSPESLPRRVPGVEQSPVQAVFAGISLVPGDSVDITFDASQADGVITIITGSDTELQVRATDASAGFSVRPNGVRVQNQGSTASYEISLPARASSVRIHVAGQLVFRRLGTAITSASRPDTSGAYVVPLLRAPSP